MENASKALIIAGAILISILLITLGIVIYNMASSAVQNNGMNDVEIQQFNQKFLQFEGTKNGAQLKTLIQTIQSNNSNEENDGIREVGITVDDPSISLTVGSDGQATGSVSTVNIKANQKYDISMAPADDGLIHSITVTKHT